VILAILLFAAGPIVYLVADWPYELDSVLAGFLLGLAIWSFVSDKQTQRRANRAAKRR